MTSTCSYVGPADDDGRGGVCTGDGHGGGTISHPLAILQDAKGIPEAVLDIAGKGTLTTIPKSAPWNNFRRNVVTEE